ncbi:class I SAM-dependent methyltransferase, partial [Acinetobacter baumannii]|nr:class I SAM-dependent methyltransferase [Acinetobacter baumannii]
IYHRDLSQYLELAIKNMEISNVLIIPFAFNSLDVFIKNNDYQYVIADINDLILEKARSALNKLKKNISYEKRDILLKQDNYFDLIVVPAEAFQMFNAKQRNLILSNLLNVLKNNGLLVIDCVNFKILDKNYRKDIPCYLRSEFSKKRWLFKKMIHIDNDTIYKWIKIGRTNENVDIEFYYTFKNLKDSFCFNTIIHNFCAEEFALENSLKYNIDIDIFGNYSKEIWCENSSRTIFEIRKKPSQKRIL